MISLLRAAGAEILKLKRTLALWMALLAPLVVVALQFLIVLTRGEDLIRAGANPWVFLSRNIFMLWSIIMLPLFIALEAALLGHIEHSGSNWKHIFATPLPRRSIYVAKLLAGLILAALGSLVMFCLILLSGGILAQIKPVLALAETPCPWIRFLELAFVPFVAAWLLIAIHTWISLRWPNFVLALGIGVAGTMASLFLINSEYGLHFPWTIPALAVNTRINQLFGGDPSPVAAQVQSSVLLALILAAVVAVLGCLHVTRRDVL